MKTLRVAFCSLGLGAFLLGSVACGNSALKEMESVVDEVCACKDMECAKKAMEKLEKIKEPEGKPSESDMKKGMELAGKMEKCMKKIMGGGGDEGGDKKEGE